MDLLKFAWLLPVIILVWIFYILPLWIMREITLASWITTNGGIKIPIFLLKKPDSFYGRLWKDWAGWSGPWVIIVKGSKNDRIISTTILHESQHCDDQTIWGPFFYPAYILHSIYLWLFCKTKHAYLDNYFERRARKAAWQKVDIPSTQWFKGPEDRWPWW